MKRRLVAWFLIGTQLPCAAIDLALQRWWWAGLSAVAIALLLPLATGLRPRDDAERCETCHEKMDGWGRPLSDGAAKLCFNCYSEAEYGRP